MSAFAGWLAQRYGVNRPLSDAERNADVRNFDGMAKDPIDQGIIALNPTFIEYVDRHFYYRGWGEGDVGAGGHCACRCIRRCDGNGANGDAPGLSKAADNGRAFRGGLDRHAVRRRGRLRRRCRGRGQGKPFVYGRVGDGRGTETMLAYGTQATRDAMTLNETLRTRIKGNGGR